MTLRQYLQVLRARWIYVLAGLLLGGVLAGAYIGYATKEYTAHAQLFVSTSTGQESSLSDINAGGTFVQDQVKSYASVATTPTLTAPIITDLGLPYSPDQLASEISASAPLDTVLINLTVTDKSAYRAASIANALATRLTAYIAQLETPIGQNVSPVKATVTQRAQVPTTPSSPKTKIDLALGLLIGLLAGVGMALVLDALDNRVGGHVDISRITNAPVVGFIGEDNHVKDRPLILLDDAFSPRAEAFRQLRTNVRFLGIDSLLRTVVVTGSVAAEGKSLTAANLAIALAQAGERVTLVDADLRRPTVATTFGLSSGVGLTSVLVGTSTASAALQDWRDDLPLRILTSGPVPPNPSELIGSQRLVDLIAELLTDSDIVLFDSPPLLPVTDAALLARVTDGALVVTRAKATKAGQLAAAVVALRSADAHVLGVIVNRVPRKRRGGYSSYGAYGTYAHAANDGYRPNGTPDISLPTGDPTPALPTGGDATSSRNGSAPATPRRPAQIGPSRDFDLAARTAAAAANAVAREQRVRDVLRQRSAAAEADRP
jgi:succinoglycan biosynthesis transport protein ExoP